MSSRIFNKIYDKIPWARILQKPLTHKKKPFSEDNIIPSQKQPLPNRLPQNLFEWLATINRRYKALNQEKNNDAFG